MPPNLSLGSGVGGLGSSAHFAWLSSTFQDQVAVPGLGWPWLGQVQWLGPAPWTPSSCRLWVCSPRKGEEPGRKRRCPSTFQASAFWKVPDSFPTKASRVAEPRVKWQATKLHSRGRGSRHRGESVTWGCVPIGRSDPQSPRTHFLRPSVTLMPHRGPHSALVPGSCEVEGQAPVNDGVLLPERSPSRWRPSDPR